MKIKKFMAAGLCGVMLLTGCGTAPGESGTQSATSENSSYSEESSYESSVSSVTSSVQSSSTTSSAVSTPQKVEPKIPVATLNQDAITVNVIGNYISVPFTTDIDFDPNEKYSLRIYSTNLEYPENEIYTETIFDTDTNELRLDLFYGDYYHTVQFYTKEKDGKLSNKIFYSFNPPKHKEFEFYTMTGAMYGKVFESLIAYPDYEEVDLYLAQGITPTHMNVYVYYRCLLCGTETYCGKYKYSYSEGEAKPVSYHCDNNRCSNHSGGGDFLISRIVG